MVAGASPTDQCAVVPGHANYRPRDTVKATMHIGTPTRTRPLPRGPWMCPSSSPVSKPVGREQAVASILMATERLSEQGQPSTFTVREIAAEAGVSTSLLYFYFSSKDAVVLATLRSIAAEIDGELQESVDLVQTAAVVQRFFVKRPGFPRILAWILLEGGSFVQLKDDPILTRFKSGFAGVGARDPFTSAGVVVTMLLGNALFQAGVNGGIEREPTDMRLGQAVNQSVLDYIAECDKTSRE